jgi:hypothetical protein
VGEYSSGSRGGGSLVTTESDKPKGFMPVRGLSSLRGELTTKTPSNTCI